MNDPALVFLAAARGADLRKWAHSAASVQHLPPKVPPPPLPTPGETLLMLLVYPGRSRRQNIKLLSIRGQSTRRISDSVAAHVSLHATGLGQPCAAAHVELPIVH